MLLHAPLWRAQCIAAAREGESTIAQACRRDAVEDHTQRSDRIEWQAGFICGALLMPKRRIDLLVQRFLSTHSSSSELAGSADTEELVERVTVGFRVSRQAARVRLGQLGVVRDEMPAG